MPITTLHTISQIEFTHASTSFSLSQINNYTLDSKVSVVMNRGAGQPAPSHIAAMSADPMLTFTSTEIARVLSNINFLTGLEIDSTGSGYTALTAYFSKIQLRGVRQSGSNHYKTAFISALVVPTRLTAQQDQEATVDVEVYGMSADGTTAPWVITASVALPTEQVANQKWTLGPAFINGTQVSGLKSLTYDFGLEVVTERTDGNQYPQFVGIKQQGHKITLSTNHLAHFATFGLTGTGQGATASNFYLRKLSNRGVRVADGTAEHIKFTVNASQGYFTMPSFGGSNNEGAAGDIVCDPTYGSSALASINTAVAITS